MSSQVPTKTTVLVIGGGPGGSYTAAALAREGIDTVLLEAETFPRYHIGESMLASMRHLLRFIDLDDKFNAYGFTEKVGAAFKLNAKREGYTDFLVGGPDNYAWNVVRSEADHLMFAHAKECGAIVFDAHKVTSIHFDEHTSHPISASWSSKAGTTGTIAFDFLVDASGRAGVLSTRYLKTRTFNQGLKNVACWGYWGDVASTYAPGTPRENSPYFESLKDESGWAWAIPLHTGVMSVGVVQNQEIANRKKKARVAAGQTNAGITKEFYLEELKQAPGILALLGEGGKLLASGPGKENDSEDTVEVKSASDYSYSASSYAGPGYRIVGDAGAFIDPYFSSGVHLALTGALTASASICASIKGEVPEEEAAKWHSDRVGIAYTRFLLVVLSAYKQIRAQTEPVLADFSEDNFDRAFSFFRPVIQGTAELSSSQNQSQKQALSQEELDKTLDFCAHAFAPVQPSDHDAVLAKVKAQTINARDDDIQRDTSASTAVHAATQDRNNSLTSEEERVLKYINARKMMRTDDTMGIANLAADVVGGLKMRMEVGNLGLEKVCGKWD